MAANIIIIEDSLLDDAKRLKNNSAKIWLEKAEEFLKQAEKNKEKGKKVVYQMSNSNAKPDIIEEFTTVDVEKFIKWKNGKLADM